MEFRGRRVKVVNRMFMDAEYSFSMLKFYYNEVVNLLDMRAKDFRTSTDEIEAEHKRIGRPFDKEFWLKHYDVYSEYYPTIFNNSFILSACALFESNIQKICALAKEEHRAPLEWDDMEGNAAARAKSYLWHSGVLLKEDRPDPIQEWLATQGQRNLTVPEMWEDLQNYYRIRNCVVHHGGSISKMRYQTLITKYATAQAILKEEKGLKQLKLSPDFNREVCDTMGKFFQKVMSAYYSTPLPP